MAKATCYLTNKANFPYASKGTAVWIGCDFEVRNSFLDKEYCWAIEDSGILKQMSEMKPLEKILEEIPEEKDIFIVCNEGYFKPINQATIVYLISILDRDLRRNNKLKLWCEKNLGINLRTILDLDEVPDFEEFPEWIFVEQPNFTPVNFDIIGRKKTLIKLLAELKFYGELD